MLRETKSEDAQIKSAKEKITTDVDEVVAFSLSLSLKGPPNGSAEACCRPVVVVVIVVLGMETKTCAQDAI